MYALKQWEVEILVKNNETWVFVHRAIINVNGEYKVLTPSEFSNTELYLAVWESQTIEIIQGTNNHNYRVVKYSPNVSVSLIWNNTFHITALDDSYDRVRVAFYDEDKEYSGELAYVNIVENGSWGSSSGWWESWGEDGFNPEA